MVLQIVLDNSKQLGILHCYAPGQLVTGRVIYTPNRPQEDIQDISLQFVGRGNLESDLNKYGHNTFPDLNAEYLLFRQEKQLFQGPFTVTKQNHTWSFKFVFPQQRSTQGNSWPLPPSFSQYFMERFTNYPGFEVLTRYELRAAVNYSSAVRPQTSSLVQVAFRTFATDPMPKPQIQKCNLKPATARSLKQKLNPFYSRKSSPNLQVVISLPKILAPSLVQPLFLFQSSAELEKSKPILEDVELVLQSSTKSVYGAHATRKE